MDNHRGLCFLISSVYNRTNISIVASDSIKELFEKRSQNIDINDTNTDTIYTEIKNKKSVLSIDDDEKFIEKEVSDFKKELNQANK